MAAKATASSIASNSVVIAVVVIDDASRGGEIF